MTSKVVITSDSNNVKEILVNTTNTGHILQPGQSCEIWVHGSQNYSVAEGNDVSTGPGTGGTGSLSKDEGFSDAPSSPGFGVKRFGTQEPKDEGGIPVDKDGNVISKPTGEPNPSNE